MPMMQVGVVWVTVCQRFMDMLVCVALGQVEPDAQGHETARDQQQQRHRLAQSDGGDGSQKRRDGKIGAGARSAEMAQAQHE